MSGERIPLGGVDAILLMARVLASTAPEGVRCSGFPPAAQTSLMGQVIDLKSAYKQLTRSRAGAPFTAIAIWNPEDHKVAYFDSIVLPFGHSGSVQGYGQDRYRTGLLCGQET